MTILRELADQYGVLDHNDVPDEVRRAARHCILDWTGCAIAGQDEPLAKILRAELLPGTVGPAHLVGRAESTIALHAALINGAAGHALDFDDTNLTMAGHPTAPVLPAVLALADAIGATGRDLVTALIVGTEVEVRLAHVLGSTHYSRGWHATATLGVIGAAAACSRLLESSPEVTSTAMALAVTQAGGLKASFGTMAKPLHAGRAASDGLLAAQLAAGGFTGNPGIIEASQGLAAASLAEGQTPRSLDDVASRWFTGETHFKFHAACYGTHAAINSALELFRQLGEAGVSHDDIVDVKVLVTPSLINVCGIDRPRTGLEGKFSLRAATALTLLGENTADLTQYSDARMQASDLLSMLDRVQVVGDDAQPGSTTTVTVASASGRTLEASYDSGVRRHDLDAEWDALVAKFHALVDGRLAVATADEIIGSAATLDDDATPGFAWAGASRIRQRPRRDEEPDMNEEGNLRMTQTAFDPAQFPLAIKGHKFEEFTEGRTFEHHWGRTLTQADNVVFSTALCHWTPMSLNVEYARAHGHPDVMVNPMLVLCTAVGLSVEDLSEAGGPFLGIEDCAFHHPVYPGDTIRASSTVVAARESESRPDTGIVTWHTQVVNQHDAVVLTYHRTNLVEKHNRATKTPA